MANSVRKSFTADGSWTAPGGVHTATVRLIQKNSIEFNGGPDNLSFCALAPNGAAYSWGRNLNGELGVGDVVPRSSPVLVLGGLKFTQVSAGGSQWMCGISELGDAYAWGANASGQLGQGGITVQSSPVLVLGGIKFVQIAAGERTALALTVAGAAYAWGANDNGQLGLGDVIPRSSPVLVLGGLAFSKVIVGQGVGGTSAAGSCVGLLSDGTAYAWGGNTNGQLGVGDVTPRSSPVLVLGGLKFSMVAAGACYFLGVTTTGVVYAWGSNANGELGVGDVVPRSSPVLVLGGLTAMAVAGGGDSSVGNSNSGSALLTTAGTVYSWGANAFGQGGLNNTIAHSSPILVVGGLTAQAIYAGIRQLFLQTKDGKLYGTGQNINGNLGVGDTTDRSSPTLVVGSFISNPMQEQVVAQVQLPVTPGTAYAITLSTLIAAFGTTPIGIAGRRYMTVSYDT